MVLVSGSGKTLPYYLPALDISCLFQDEARTQPTCFQPWTCACFRVRQDLSLPASTASPGHIVLVSESGKTLTYLLPLPALEILCLFQSQARPQPTCFHCQPWTYCACFRVRQAYQTSLSTSRSGYVLVSGSDTPTYFHPWTCACFRVRHAYLLQALDMCLCQGQTHQPASILDMCLCQGQTRLPPSSPGHGVLVSGSDTPTSFQS